MPISTDDFWKLTVASGLLPRERCQKLQAEFAGLKGAAAQANAGTLGEWLVGSRVLTRYQASVLQSGRPGPFVFGDFVIEQRIESGRLAKCFRARYQGKQTALLMFAAGSADSPAQTRAMMEQLVESRAVKCPHVARVYQFQASARPPFFVIEDLSGRSMREAVDREKLSLSAACRAGFQAALGLVAMHEQRAVHGNLCPDNVWRDDSSSIKLLQFPLARPAWGDERLQSTIADYLAPELNDADRAPDALSDIYGLGCLLYEWISGRVPFPGGTVAQKRARHASEVPERLDRLVSGVSEELADLVAEMLDKETMLRAATASHVAHLLSPFTADVAERRTAMPPRQGPQMIAPGYGAWHEPGWQAPPQQSPRPAQPAVEPAATPPRSRGPSKPDISAQPAAGHAAPTAPTRTAAPGEARDAAHSLKRPSSASKQPLAAAPEPASPSSTDATEQLDPDIRSNPPVIIVESRTAAPSFAATDGAALIPRKRNHVAAIAVAVTLAVLAFAVVAIYLLAGTEEPGTERSKTADEAVMPAEPSNGMTSPTDGELDQAATAAADAAATDGVTLVDDDGQTLWASPTSGLPLDVRYVPSSAQLLLALRPAELLADDEGVRLLAALGPAASAARSQLQLVLGVDLVDVEQLLIGFAPDESGAPQATYVLRLARQIPEEELLAAWGGPRASEHAKGSYFVGAAVAYHLPPGGAGRVVVIAPEAVLREILERDGQPILRKGIEGLLDSSDTSRHISMLLVPSYLLSDGRSLLPGNLEKLGPHLERIFDMQTQAVLASAHLGSELFLELRVAGPADVRPQQLAIALRDELETAGQQVEEHVTSLTPQPYGRLIIHRFPRMLQLLGNFTRAAAEGRQAVLRCYLPTSAAHNLALGAELTLQETIGVSAVAQGTSAAPMGRGAAAALDRVVSLSFPRDTLEHSLELLAVEIDTPIVIEGADLQLEGITKNQSFGLDERNKPGRQILAAILQRANAEGKLTYVIRAGEGLAESIHVTTRAGAARRGERLPAELDEKTPAKNP